MQEEICKLVHIYPFKEGECIPLRDELVARTRTHAHIHTYDHKHPLLPAPILQHAPEKLVRSVRQTDNNRHTHESTTHLPSCLLVICTDTLSEAGSNASFSINLKVSVFCPCTSHQTDRSFHLPFLTVLVPRGQSTKQGRR